MQPPPLSYFSTSFLPQPLNHIRVRDLLSHSNTTTRTLLRKNPKTNASAMEMVAHLKLKSAQKGCGSADKTEENDKQHASSSDPRHKGVQRSTIWKRSTDNEKEQQLKHCRSGRQSGPRTKEENRTRLDITNPPPIRRECRSMIEPMGREADGHTSASIDKTAQTSKSPDQCIWEHSVDVVDVMVDLLLGVGFQHRTHFIFHVRNLQLTNMR
ncbi:hypothetical protein FF1_019471 [Malus domestica]